MWSLVSNSVPKRTFNNREVSVPGITEVVVIWTSVSISVLKRACSVFFSFP